jgi:Ca2+-binding RTX toxin-like protein
MRRVSLASLVASVALAGSLLGLAVNAALAAAGTLDQSQTSAVAGFGVGPSQHVGQTFTPGLSGSLDQADLYLGRTCTSPTGNLRVQIRTVSGGTPTNDVLATASVPAASVPVGTNSQNYGWVEVPFAAAATVSAGTLYAIVASTGGTCPSIAYTYWWGLQIQNPYGGGTDVYSLDGGASWTISGVYDNAFKTYVLTPGSPTPAPAPSPGAAAPTCSGKQATIVGTDGADQITGTPGADVIVGLGGNDVIKGGDQADVICGDGGDDVINGKSGEDLLLGEQGNDRLNGAGKNDQLFGGPGKDRLGGGFGRDRLFGGPGVDQLFGGFGQDTLRGGPGKDKQVQ